MAEGTKDTVYIDVDDEITSIIEKVRASKHKIVALVLPKRATTLQSVVNMKLLKRTGEETGKRIVLITSEAGLLPLAGVVGLHTAKTLQSKPVIPPTPDTSQTPETLIDDEPETDEDPNLDDSKSIGELAGMTAVAAAATAGDDTDDTIEVDNTDPEEDEAAAATAGAAGKKAKKLKKDKKKKVPNFNSFRMKLFFGIAALLLAIVAWYVAFNVLARAKITVHANTTTVNISTTITADTTATSVNTDTGVVPAQLKVDPKTDSVNVPATGTKDIGTKASGSVVLTTKECAPNLGQTPSPVPAGSGVSTNGLTFITQSSATFTFTNFSSGSCANYSSGNINVVAQQNGDKYNVGANQTFSVAGASSVSGSNGSAFTGGTSNIVKVVTQADIDAGQQKLLDKNGPVAKTELTQQFQSIGYQPILETFSAGTPKVTSTPNVGDQADSVTVNATINYSMLGVKRDDLKQVIDAQAKKQIDLSKQPIQDYGFDQLTFTVVETTSPNKVKVSMSTTVTAGVKLDTEALKQQVAGKKKGDIQQIIGSQPGVTQVDVSFSPFWISSAPKNTKHITIVIVQTNGK